MRTLDHPVAQFAADHLLKATLALALVANLDIESVTPQSRLQFILDSTIGMTAATSTALALSGAMNSGRMIAPMVADSADLIFPN